MADNYNKYIKYKTKYLELIGGTPKQGFGAPRQIIWRGGKNNKYILVDGTSSAGKSTICKYFSEKNFLKGQQQGAEARARSKGQQQGAEARGRSKGQKQGPAVRASSKGQQNFKIVCQLVDI